MEAYCSFMSPSPFPQGRTSDEIRRQPRVHQLCGLKAEPRGRAHQTADLMEKPASFQTGRQECGFVQSLEPSAYDYLL